MRVLVIATGCDPLLRSGLELAGHEVIASAGSSTALLHAVERTQPDLIVIDVDSPGPDLLDLLGTVSLHAPRPVVMFATDGAPEAIRGAVSAGVSAYVVNGLDPARMRTIIDVAVARFEDAQRLREELADANLKLAERKIIDRAKGVLMKTRGLDEDAAYAFMRKAAMDRKQKLAEVAQRLVDAADLLGA